MVSEQEGAAGEDGWRREFRIELPARVPLLKLAIPKDAGVSRAWVNGELALDNSIESKYKRDIDVLRLVWPGDGPVTVSLLTPERRPLRMSALTWHDLPPVLVAPFMGNWPRDAQPFLFGPRAEKIQEFDFPAVPVEGAMR